MPSNYSEDELLEAKRQIGSILHKLRETVRALSEKENADRLKSQITLAQRRIQALGIANALIEEAMGVRIWRLSENPAMIGEAAEWFSSKWDIPVEAYQKSIEGSVHCADSVPQWYIVRLGNAESGRIIAGCGIIENDFHDHPDLAPNLCALFVEEEHRGRGLARRLVEHAGSEAHRLGRDELYLITDHVGLYERFGWKYRGDVTDSDGVTVRLYQAP
ncbi:GNAT family N-acetyltransferase [Adlercreutzia murintestinalis]|uniref:GNAT family N-acetyltransferase n=1 Tax=Adlercreutzia murintestinalis TaxID=2941325 RepID=UPI00203C2E6F|nr:GNAT family N-acetyltransferase [Adlercreutzia murintestinalis]